MKTIDLKFHVVSIVAVFVALGLGILVGANTRLIGGTSNLLEKQDGLIKRLEEKYKDLDRREREYRQISARKEAESEEHIQRLEGRAVPELARGQLKGFRYGLVELNLEADSTFGEGLTTFLNEAGAAPGYRVSLSLETALDLAGEQPEAFINAAGRALVWGESEPPEELQKAHEEERAMAAPDGEGAFLAELRQRGSIRSGGFGEPVDGVIVIVGGEPAKEAVALLLAPLQNKIKSWDAFQAMIFPDMTPDLERTLKRSRLAAVAIDGSVASKAGLIVQIREKALAKKDEGLSD